MTNWLNLNLKHPFRDNYVLQLCANVVDKAIEISWSTISENNNDYMAIGRSANGIEFHEIARIDGNGNSQESKSYKHLDKFPLLGMN